MSEELLIASFSFTLYCLIVVEHFVITGIRKTALHKTEYRLSSLGKPDLWCKLKRGEKKSGYPFRPNRKVLFINGEEEQEAK